MQEDEGVNGRKKEDGGCRRKHPPGTAALDKLNLSTLAPLQFLPALLAKQVAGIYEHLISSLPARPESFKETPIPWNLDTSQLPTV